jgi:hypothetical protein
MRHAVKAPVGEEEIRAADCKRDALSVPLDELDLVKSERGARWRARSNISGDKSSAR